MIVQRVTVQVKQGHVREFLALAKSQDSVLDRATKRTYTSNISPVHNIVAFELEFEDLGELDKTWAAWGADPDTPAYMEKWNKLVKDSGSEVWNLK